jgi:serine phosphatase RsbU (regulator of sigma subunit)/anti-sigma regulatory factor (Ser/Thr protein kinase)
MRVFSMRLIVSAVGVLLVSAAVIGAGAVSERNARRALTQALETRLVLEARNLSTIASNALLTDFPELTLHPVVKDIKSDRPDLESVVVVDHKNTIQGHVAANLLGKEYTPKTSLKPREANVSLTPDEELLEDSDMLMIASAVRHPNGSTLGRVFVGLKRSHAEAMLIATRKNQLLFFLPLLAGSILLTTLLMSRLLRPISDIRDGIEKIGRGELDTRVEMSSRTELSLVASSINEMAGRLKSAQRALLENERLEHEMQLAHDIQRSLLPKESTECGDFLITGDQQAAAEVGGDYYDVFPLSGGKLGVVIADVAGKGLGGCLVTSMLAILIRSLRSSHSRPSDLIVAVHENIMHSLRPETFITMFYGVLDPDSGTLTFASAGHNPLLHYQAASGSLHYRKTKGVPVGLLDGDILRRSIVEDSLIIEPGDLVLQTTDGFHEAVNRNLEQYGFDRIADTVKPVAHQGGQTVISEVQRSVAEWEAGQPAGDDKTLLVITRATSENTVDDSHTWPADRTELPTAISALWKNRDRGNLLSVPARLEALEDLSNRLRNCPGLERESETVIKMLEHGLYEIIANIAEHGCSLDDTKVIDVWWIRDPVTPHRAMFLIRDYGVPPRPDTWMAGDAQRSKGRGYGLELIEKTLIEVRFFPNTTDGNVTVVPVEFSGIGTR